MKANRRDCLRAGALAGAGALLTGCSSVLRRINGPPMPETVALPPEGADRLTRLVNRLSFGPRPNDVDGVSKLGPKWYVEDQLKAETPEPFGLRFRLHNLEALHTDAYELKSMHESEVLQQLQRAALLHAVYSPNQLRERMVDFWTNHFNIYARKGMGVYFKPADEMRVIRENALGHFPTMLKASARSPAMLAYLDNQVNLKGHPNENYAREIMELHTLGVHGGYTQKDVMEVARCLTGWSIETRFLIDPNNALNAGKVFNGRWDEIVHLNKGGFRFDASKHDNGRKVVLGEVIPPGGGERDGDRVLDVLARHPSTARFISTKICRHFLGEHTGDWPDQMAAIYLRTGGDIRAMLRPLLLSDEIINGQPILKRPFDFMASAFRALNANTDCGPAAQDHLLQMGQPLYLWPMPDGYPDKTVSWTGSLLGRWNFAVALCTGQIQGTTCDTATLIRRTGAISDSESVDALVELVFSRSADSESLRPLTEKVRTVIARGAGSDSNPVVAEATALALASPEFQWR